MQLRSSVLAGLCVSLLIAGCASDPAVRPTEATPVTITPMTPVDGVTVEVARSKMMNHFDFEVPVEKLWTAMMETHAAIGIPISTADQRKGTAMFMVQNRYRRIMDRPASSYLDCGTGPTGLKADSYRLLIRVHHTLVPVGDDKSRSLLTTVVEYFATNPGVSGDPVSCVSNGRLERDIAALIKARLLQS